MSLYLIVTVPDAGDTLTLGQKTYQWTIAADAVEGARNMVVDLPYLRSINSAQSKVTIAYSIKSTTSSVSNTEVLAAIVKLIASINKQIVALQKLLTKKK